MMSFLFLLLIIIVLLIFFKNFYIKNIKDFFDDNTVLITKTIKLLITIYKYSNNKNKYNYYKDDNKNIIDLCIKNKLIIKKNNTLFLTPTALQICFNYTNNKFIFLNIAFIIFNIILVLINVYLQVYTK